MSNVIDITSNDISLVKQQRQRRYLKVQLVDRNWNSLCIIHGRLISATSNIDSSSGIRRSANITIETEQRVIELPTQNIVVDLQKDISANYYIRLWAGIEDNNTLVVTWYNQGLFVINKSDYSFNPETRTLSMGLIDIMCDLTGERAGILHAYTTLVKGEQRIDDVMKNVLELAGFNAYAITPIVPLQSMGDNNVYAPTEEDYMIPYDKNFDVGVSAYDILAWLVSLYPYYEMGFDVEGTFFCRKKLLDQDDSYPLIDGVTLRGLVISEDTSLDWLSIKNDVEVWGRDGLFYGEAKDENPESPFQVASTNPYRYVISSSEDGIDTNNICDRYKDTELAYTLQKEQVTLENTIARLEKLDEPTQEERAELQQAKQDLSVNKSKQKANIAITGDELAKQWAQQKLYEKSRMYDSVTIITVGMPFINDVDFKLSYRSKVDDTIRPYKVESVAHDYIAGTSTFGMVRFYDEQCSNYWDKLDEPIINEYHINKLDFIVNVIPVTNANQYQLYIDGQLVVTSTGTTLLYTFDNWQEGEHTFYVVAKADYYRSNSSEIYTINISVLNRLISDTNTFIISNDGQRIIINEPVFKTIVSTNNGDTIITNNGSQILINEVI